MSGRKRRNRKHKSKGRRARKAKSTKLKDGREFELRAKRALQHIHPEWDLSHNEKLPAIYARPRQFDVLARDRSLSGALARSYEAKDYAGKVPIEKVEAFVTKTSELQGAPTQGAGMVSASGFQTGPLERAKVLRGLGPDRDVIKEYYQLRQIEPSDWEGKFREFYIHGTTKYPTIVSVKAVPPEAISGAARKEVSLGLGRFESFLFDEKGDIVGNLIDLVNKAIGTAAVKTTEVGSDGQETEVIPFDERRWIKTSLGKLEIQKVEVTLMWKERDSRFSIDFADAVDDVLIDCLTEARTFIPSEKSLSVSSNGNHVALSFSDEKSSDSSSLYTTTPPKICSNSDLEKHAADFSKSIFLNMLLHIATAANSQEKSTEELAVVEKIKRAGELLNEKKHDQAAALYEETLRFGASLPALINLAYINQEKGDLAKAKKLVATACGLFPTEVQGFVAYIELCIRERSFGEIEELYKAANVLHMHRPELIKARARAFFHEEKYLEAASAYLPLTNNTVYAADAFRDMAICESKAGYEREAAFDALNALELDPRNTLTFFVAIDFLVRAKCFSKVVHIIDVYSPAPSIALSPSQTNQLLYWLTEAVKGDPELGAKVRTLGARIFAGNERLNLFLGSIFYFEGAFSEARKMYEMHIINSPNDVSATIDLARISMAQGNYRHAKQVLTGVSKPKQNDAAFWDELAIAATGARDKGLACECGSRVSELGGDAARVLLSCANFAHQLGELELGMELGLASLRYPGVSESDRIEQATLKLGPNSVGQLSAEDIWASVSDLDSCERRDMKWLYLKALLGIRTGNKAIFDNAMAYLELSSTVNIISLQIATELAGFQWHSECAHVLDKYNPQPETFGPPEMFPSPSSLRVLAMLGLGEKWETVTDFDTANPAEREHHLDYLRRAHILYISGALADCVSCLLEREKKHRMLDFEGLLLRINCLLELGRYSEAVADISKYLNPVGDSRSTIEWCMRTGDLDLKRIRSTADWAQRAHLIPVVAGVHNCDFIVAAWDGVSVKPMLMGCADIMAGFRQLREIYKNDSLQPLVIRGRIPIATVKALRNLLQPINASTAGHK